MVNVKAAPSGAVILYFLRVRFGSTTEVGYLISLTAALAVEPVTQIAGKTM
jgi:hypothetical protein